MARGTPFSLAPLHAHALIPIHGGGAYLLTYRRASSGLVGAQAEAHVLGNLLGHVFVTSVVDKSKYRELHCLLIRYLLPRIYLLGNSSIGRGIPWEESYTSTSTITFVSLCEALLLYCPPPPESPWDSRGAISPEVVAFTQLSLEYSYTVIGILGAVSVNPLGGIPEDVRELVEKTVRIAALFLNKVSRPSSF